MWDKVTKIGGQVQNGFAETLNFWFTVLRSFKRAAHGSRKGVR